MASRRQQPKDYFTETEAARSLGISVEEFRNLVRQHLSPDEQMMGNMSETAYKKSNLMLLKLLTGRPLEVEQPAFFGQ
ncbi:MAG: hypothetical protein R2762_28580 [Bryobacteraceae bacterium]